MTVSKTRQKREVLLLQFFLVFFFFPRCYYESLKNESVLDFQCHAQISFFLDLGTNVTLFLTIFFLELPKNRKKKSLLFFLFATFAVFVFPFQGTGGVGGVYTVQRTKLKLFCINPPFGTIRWVPFPSLPCGIPLEMGSTAFPAPQGVPSPAG